MPDTLKKTDVTTVRLSVTQLAALKQLPPSITISILVRALLQAYLDGTLPPGIYTQVLEEARRTEEARHNGQHTLLRINAERKQKKNAP